jgi:hypothetical protein
LNTRSKIKLSSNLIFFPLNIRKGLAPIPWKWLTRILMEVSSVVLGSNGQESGWVSLSFPCNWIGFESSFMASPCYRNELDKHVTGRITVMERGERGEFLFVLFV